MPTRASLRRAITLSVIGLVLIAVIVGTTLWSAGQQERSFNWVEHTLSAQNQIRAVYNRIQQAEAAQRGYLLIGEERYLVPYEAAMNGFDEAIEALSATLQDNPAQKGAFEHVRGLLYQRIALFQETIAMGRAGKAAEAIELIRQGEGLVQMEAIRADIRAMMAAEESLLAERRAEADEQTNRVRIGLIVGFALVLLLAAAAMIDARKRLREIAAARDLLANANSRLHAEATERAAAEAKLRQSQKMESLGQLTGGIAHDFNNMLAIVIGSLDLARRRIRTEPDRAEKGIDTAFEGAQRAASLTARLLAFSRQQPLAPTVCDINKIVSNMSELLRRSLGEEVELETVLAGGLWRVFADCPQVETAILNLAVNARDAMPGGGKLTIETANAYLDDAYAASHVDVTAGQYVAISITDTGTGMTPETIERAFDPFYTTKGVGKGTGLGLSQVFGFVKQSNGHVKIYSELGQGTSLKIYLPRHMGEGALDSTDAPPVAAARGFETVLVVEDEDSVRRVTVDTLRELGYTVIHASGGREALGKLDQHPKIDLLFTDVVMPEMSGRVLADEAVKLRPGMKVLYATGYTRNAVVHNGMLDPGVAFLSKPFTMDQLAQKVRAVLDGQGINRPA